MEITNQLDGIPTDPRDAAVRGGVIVNPALIIASQSSITPYCNAAQGCAFVQISAVALIVLADPTASDDRGWNVVDQRGLVILGAGLFREEALLAAGWLGFARAAGTDTRWPGLPISEAFSAWFCVDCGNMRGEHRAEARSSLCGECARERELEEAEMDAADEARELVRCLGDFAAVWREEPGS